MQEKKIPVIIDTDPGVDDAIAIMIAASSGKLDIKGITPVDGNVKYYHTFPNALRLVEFLKLDCPVAKGAETQLEKPCPTTASCHGKTGLGSVELPEPTTPYHEKRAWDFIYDTARDCGGELEIIAIGPLTNIAKLVLEHPDAKDYVKRIICMGGSTEEGNMTPYAEFNFWVDPAAAKVVFESGIPIVLAGLNVTLKTGISFRFIDQLCERAGASPYAKALKEFVSSYSDTHDNKEGEHASVVHDATAVMYAVDPEGCTTERCHIEIKVDEEQYGRSYPTYGDPSSYNTTVITDLDMRRYEQLYLNMMDYFNSFGE